MLTVRELKGILLEIERDWTEEDENVLGDFNNFGVYVLPPRDGVARVEKSYFDVQFGFLLVTEQ